MSIIQQMREALTLTSGEMSNYGYQIWNHFIHGDYGIANYKDCLVYKNVDYKKQRAFVINNYTALLALEFGCSYGYAQKVIVELFAKDKLESITNEFINDLNNLGE
mgnify:FL=1